MTFNGVDARCIHRTNLIQLVPSIVNVNRKLIVRNNSEAFSAIQTIVCTGKRKGFIKSRRILSRERVG